MYVTAVWRMRKLFIEVIILILRMVAQLFSSKMAKMKAKCCTLTEYGAQSWTKNGSRTTQMAMIDISGAFWCKAHFLKSFICTQNVPYTYVLSVSVCGIGINISHPLRTYVFFPSSTYSSLCDSIQISSTTMSLHIFAC